MLSLPIITSEPPKPEGNTTASNSNGYVYDFENHLLQANGITYVYDGDGNRVYETVARATTSYWVDDQPCEIFSLVNTPT